MTDGQEQKPNPLAALLGGFGGKPKEKTQENKYTAFQ